MACGLLTCLEWPPPCGLFDGVRSFGPSIQALIQNDCGPAVKVNPHFLMQANPSGSDVITCRLSDCGCQCHISLPPPEERWYCVFVGTSPGPVQGRKKALKSYQNISGGYTRYCSTKDEAEIMYREALCCSQAILVRPPTRKVLQSSQLKDLPGFRNRIDDPICPEEASWMVVLVGRRPGVYLLDKVGTIGIQENIKFIKGARAIPHVLRSDTEEEFVAALEAGKVVQVDRGQDIRVVLTPETAGVIDGESVLVGQEYDD